MEDWYKDDNINKNNGGVFWKLSSKFLDIEDAYFERTIPYANNMPTRTMDDHIKDEIIDITKNLARNFKKIFFYRFNKLVLLWRNIQSELSVT